MAVRSPASRDEQALPSRTPGLCREQPYIGSPMNPFTEHPHGRRTQEADSVVGSDGNGQGPGSACGAAMAVQGTGISCPRLLQNPCDGYKKPASLRRLAPRSRGREDRQTREEGRNPLSCNCGNMIMRSRSIRSSTVLSSIRVWAMNSSVRMNSAHFSQRQ